MNIEIGKYYRARNDEKILALAMNPLVEKGSQYELIAVDEDGDVTDYGMDGRFLSNGEVSNHDLVREWIEPEDAPLEFGDIEFGTAFKPRSRMYEDMKCYPQTVGINEVSFSGGNYSYIFMKENWLMLLPGTKEWVPCSKKSIATDSDSH